jgi:hypothetical protein
LQVKQVPSLLHVEQYSLGLPQEVSHFSPFIVSPSQLELGSIQVPLIWQVPPGQLEHGIEQLFSLNLS